MLIKRRAGVSRHTIETVLSKAGTPSLRAPTLDAAKLWLFGYLDAKDAEAYWEETWATHEGESKLEQAMAVLTMVETIEPHVHEQAVRKVLVNLGGLLVEMLYKEGALKHAASDPGWAGQVRLYLAHRDFSDLEKALAMVETLSEVGCFLEALSERSWEKIVELGENLQRSLWHARRIEEAMTVQLLQLEPGVTLAGHYEQYPQTQQAEVLQQGLAALKVGIQVSDLLGDRSCSAFYLSSAGSVLAVLRRDEEAKVCWVQALAQYKFLCADDPERYRGDLADTLSNLGRVLNRQRHYEEAEATYTKALACYEKLYAAQPKDYSNRMAKTLNNQGNVLNRLHRYDEAEAFYLRSIRLREAQDNRTPEVHSKELARTLTNLGNVLGKQHRYSEAEQVFLQTLELREVLYANNPDIYSNALAMTLNQLGSILHYQRRYEEARVLYTRSLELREVLYANNPERYAEVLAMTLNNLSGVLLDSHRFDEAAAACKRAVALYEDLYEKSPEVFANDLTMALNNLGLVFKDQRHYAEAEASFARSLKLREKLYEQDPETYAHPLATILNNLGLVLKKQHRYAEAGAAYQRASSLYEKLHAANPQLYADPLAAVLNNLGLVLKNQRRYAEAEAAYQRALSLYEKLHAANQQVYADRLAAVLNNLTNLLRNQYRYKEAEDTCLQALVLYEALYADSPDVYANDLADTLNNLGTLLDDQRRYDEAEVIYVRALVLYEALYADSPDVYANDLADTLNNLGTLLDNLHRYEEAEEALSRALDLREKLYAQAPAVYIEDLAITWMNLGCLQRMQLKYDTAEASYTQALAHYEDLYTAKPEIYADRLALVCNNLGVVLHRQKRYREAEEACRRAFALLETFHKHNLRIYADSFALTLNTLGNVLLDARRFDEAEKQYRRAMEFDPKCELPSSWLARIGLGHLFYELERFDQSYTLWANVLIAIERHREHWTKYETDRTLLLQDFAHLYPWIVEVCLKLGREVEAWHWAERGKNRALLDRMGEQAPPLRAKSQALRAQWLQIDRLLQEQRDLKNHYEHANANTSSTVHKDAQPDQYKSQAAVLDRLDELERELAEERAKEAHLWKETTQTLGTAIQYLQVEVPAAEVIAQQLSALHAERKTLLVEYVMLDSDQYVVFLMPLWKVETSQRLPLRSKKVHLPHKHEIEQVIQQFTSAVVKTTLPAVLQDTEENNSSPSRTTAFDALPEAIGKTFLAPWSDLLRTTEKTWGRAEALLIIPGGAFHQLPLHLGVLRRRRSEPGEILIERYTVSYLASASLGTVLTERTKQDLAEEAAPSPPRVRLVMGPPQTDLPHAVLETKRLAKRWGTNVYAFEAMTKEVLQQHAGHLDVVHLASHSCFDRKQYLKSFIQFHGEEVLTLAELYTARDFDLDGLRLFYLSSCDSGRSGQVGTEELQGLVWALTARGAQAVFASLWPVSDRAAQHMALGFYDHLARGLSLGAALKATVQQMRQSPEFSNPYYWAPFVLYGNPNQYIL